MPSLALVAGVFGVPGLRLCGSIYQKQLGFGRLPGVFSKQCPREGPGETVAHTGCWGSHIRNSHLPVTPGPLWHMHSCDGLDWVQGPSRLLDHTKWMPRQQYHRVIYLNS